MGLHHSKTCNSSSAPLENNDPQEKSQKKTIHLVEGTEYYQWQEICRCSHDQWLSGVSEQIGFGKHSFDCHSELHSLCAPCFCPENSSRKFHHQFSNVSKWKNQSIRSSSTSISEKLREYFGYHYIPAMFSAFQHYSVHRIVNGGSSSNFDDHDTMMLSIYSAILNKTKFMMIDLKFNRHICTLDHEYNGLINVREFHSAWSTDRTRIIVLVPLGHGSTLLDFYRVVKQDAKLYRRIYPVDPSTRFQFDPNFCSSRLIFYTSEPVAHQMSMIHYDINALKPNVFSQSTMKTIYFSERSNEPEIRLKQLDSWSTIKHQRITFNAHFRLLSIFYTRDGSYLILTFTDTNCHCQSTYPISYFDIYNSQTFQCLHRFYAQLMRHLCPWHMCQNSFTPILSFSSSRLAFCTSDQSENKDFQVSVIVLPTLLNLKFICRRCIRDHLYRLNRNVTDISNLIPHRLGQYLQYRPEYQ